MLKRTCVLALAVVALQGFASAHPGEQHHTDSLAEIAKRRLFMSNGKRALQSCAASDNGRALKEKAIARRVSKVALIKEQQQRQRQLSLTTALAKNHESSLTGISAATDPDSIFGSTVACLLEPEVTQGPYYVKGEFIRNDIRETQAGIDLYMDLQFIDVNTCKPVENLYVDFWHCNATGVYSGVVASGNGDSSVASNINATFMRGLAPTDSEGVVEFITKFPGFYTGRTTHVHLMANYNGTVLSNNTYSGGAVSHVGQLFFDQTLLSVVAAADVYKKNTQTATLNSADNILANAAANSFDPFVEYVYLGSSVSDGLFAWISVGVNMSIAQTDAKQAVDWTANGGVAVSKSTSSIPKGTNTTPSPASSSSLPPTWVLLVGVMAAFQLCM